MRRSTALILTVATTAIVAAPISAAAQFGELMRKVPGVPLPDGSGGGAMSPEEWMSKAHTAGSLMSTASAVLFEAVSTKEELEQFRARRTAAQAIVDPKERETTLLAIQSDTNAALAKVDYDAQATAMESSLDKKKKQRLGAAGWNFMLGALIDAELVLTAKPTAQAAMTSGNLGAFRGVGDTAKSLYAQAKDVKAVMGGLRTLHTAGIIAQLPESTSAQPMTIAD
ncbi:MAG: hypothetical protein ACOYM5_06230 [Caulobacter sp.]